MASVMMVVTVVLVAAAIMVLRGHRGSSPTAHRPLARSRRRDEAPASGTTPTSRETSMNLSQTTVDAAEDSMIHRYLERRVHLGPGLIVACGRCGTSQVIYPGPGIHRVALVCLSCREKTLFTLPAAS
jgi:hypothetical protein